MKKLFIIALFPILAIVGIISSNTSFKSPKAADVELSEIEVLSEVEQCTAKHRFGCHAGGYDAVSCEISGAFHVCIGGVGGSCSITCGSSTYACCGLSCSCVDKKLWN